MTNLPRGTDVISSAASHHTAQNTRRSRSRRREGKGGEADPGQGCHQAAAQKTWSGGRGRARSEEAAAAATGNPNRQTDRQTDRHCATHTLDENSKMDLVAVAAVRPITLSVSPSFSSPTQRLGPRPSGRKRGEERRREELVSSNCQLT